MTRTAILIVAFMAAASALVMATLSCDRATPTPPSRSVSFVGSAKCAECHAERHKTWLTTSHAYALREATTETVRGAFDGKTVDGGKFKVTPITRADGTFAMTVTRADRTPAAREYQIVRAIGVSMQQAYLAFGERGDWQLMPLTWNLATHRWELTHHVLSDISGEDGYYQDYDPAEHVFNLDCAQCHATNFDAGYDPKTDRYAATLLEGSVSCESCHGPGAAHAARHQSGAGKEPRPLVNYRAPDRLVQPVLDLTPTQVIGACGRCHYKHSWRFAIDADPMVPWWDLAASTNFDDVGFFADGRTSGLNYEATVQVWSRCHTEGGMSCLSCHDMHSGNAFGMRWKDIDDDRQCLQCHAAFAKDPAAHSHHKDVRCVECHMPKLLDGQLRRWRDHSIQSPDPVLTEAHGAATPNACASCHATETATWAREHRDRWWKPTDARLVADVQNVMRLRADRSSVGTDELVATALDRKRRLFFRTTALVALTGRAGGDVSAAIRTLLADPAVDLRTTALDVLTRRNDEESASVVRGLMSDPASRVVRVDAAYTLVRQGYRDPSDPVLRRVYEEAKVMLDRRRAFYPVYERLACLADALDETEDFERYFSLLVERTPWPRSGDSAVELFQRRGRALMDAGKLDLARENLTAAAEARPHRATQLLIFDQADLSRLSGQTARALELYDAVIAASPPSGVAGTLAAAWAARLRREDTTQLRRQLDAALDAAKADLTAGEWRRRARAFTK